MKTLAILATLLAMAVCLTWASPTDLYPVSGKVQLSYRSNATLYAYSHPMLIRKVYSLISITLVGQSLHREALLQTDGSFTFFNVPAGPYQLEVHSPEFHFTPLRIEVSKKDEGKVKMKYIDQQGSIPSPFIIRPDAPMRYFQQPQSMISIYISILSSPMLLMMVAVVGLMTCMQYMDPEAMQELQNEVNGGKAKERLPHQVLPGLIAKPNQAAKLSRQIADQQASGPHRSGNALKDVAAEDSDSQEEEESE